MVGIEQRETPPSARGTRRPSGEDISMTTVHFRTPDIELQIRGSEPFVVRQLLLLSPTLGRVDAEALKSAGAEPRREALPPAPAPP
ncbi:MAG: hypothetical protein ACREID_07925, partial [Planctomycetota bacterium]